MNFLVWVLVAYLVWIMIYGGDDSDDEGPRTA